MASRGRAARSPSLSWQTRGRACSLSHALRPTSPCRGRRSRASTLSLMGSAALATFHQPTRDWFESSFAAPTRAQDLAWPAIASGQSTLVLAPTGSGKTLAAFLAAIDQLLYAEPAGCRVVYISPLKALAIDVERNLRGPLVGIRHVAERLGTPLREPSVATRTGDTPARDRVRFAKQPADIFITTPE